METTMSVTHVTLKVETTFELFTKNFEAAIGRFKDPPLEDILADPENTLATIKGMAGMENMYMFPTGDPGKMLRLQGGHNRVKQYGWGNPLMAGNLIKLNIGVALYAPFRLIIYENDENELYAQYDLPSSYFHQFGEEVEKVGLGLDKKIRVLIDHSVNTPA